MSDQMGKTNVKKSKQLVSAGVFIALYFVVFAVIGTVCMPVPPLYLARADFHRGCAAESILAAHGQYLDRGPVRGPVRYHRRGHRRERRVQELGAQCDKLFVLRPEPHRRLSADLGHAGLFLRRHAEPRHEPGVR